MLDKKIKECSRPLSAEEIDRARTYLEDGDLELFNLLFKTGLRIGEISEYVKQHKMSSDKFVRINPQKKNRVRVLPKLPIEYLGSYSVSTKALQKRVERWDLGFSPHDLRATFITRLYNRGVDPFVIQRLVGHRRISSTISYMYINTEDTLWIYDLIETDIGDPDNIAEAIKIIKNQRLQLARLRDYVQKLKGDN